MDIKERDILFMREALGQAREAYDMGEVPVGCVVTCGDEIVGRGFNRRETGKNALLHAETAAIYEACTVLGGWRLFMCELYVTLEPCPMCAGAIVNSRVKRVIYGAPDSKAGAFGGVFDMNSFPLNHKPEITAGVCGEECSEILRSFFRELRERKSAER